MQEDQDTQTRDADSDSKSCVVHLVAPPSLRRESNQSKLNGRTTPCMLLSSAIDNALTPPPPHNQLIIVGDSTTQITARELNLPFTLSVNPVLSNPRTTKRRIAHHLHSLPTTPSRIVCWSDELASLGSSLSKHFQTPFELISTLPSSITKPPQSIDTIRVFDSKDHDRWNDNRHTSKSDQLLADAINLEEPTNESRQAARAALAIDHNTICLAAIADDSSKVDAREFAFLLGLLSVSGYKVLGIVPSTSSNLTQAIRHHRGLDQPFRFMTTTDQLPQLLPLLDAYIHPVDEQSGSSYLLSRALSRAGIPLMNLRHSGRAGFSRAQGTSGQLLNQIDSIIEHKKQNASMSEQIAAH